MPIRRRFHGRLRVQERAAEERVSIKNKFSVRSKLSFTNKICRDIVVPKSMAATEDSNRRREQLDTKDEDNDDDVFYDTEDDPEDDTDEDLSDSAP